MSTISVRIAHRGLVDTLAERDGTTFNHTTTPLAPPLVAALVREEGASLVPLDDDSPTPQPWPEVWEQANQATRAHLDTLEPEVVRYATGAGPGVTLVETGSPLGSSAILYPEEFLPRWVDELNVDDGILVSVPVRHGLLVSPVSTGAALTDSVDKLTSTTAQLYNENPNPISPLVYLLHRVGTTMEFLPIAGPQRQADGSVQLTVTPTEYLVERLNAES